MLFEQPTGRLKVAAVGWASKDASTCGEVYSDIGFEALFAQPVTEAANQGAKLIVSPEMAFGFGDSQREEWLEKFRKIAIRQNVCLAIGYFNPDQNENRLLFMNPEGIVASEYTKTYLTVFEDYRKGNGRLRIIETDGIRVGGMICQDDNFTRLSREYGRKKVPVVAVPTLDWLTVKDAHLQSSIHRAVESRYAIVRAALNGTSAIISPMGKVLACRDHIAEGPGAVVAEVPLYTTRTTFSTLGHWPVAVSLIFLIIYIWWNFVRPRFRNHFAGRCLGENDKANC